MQPTQKVGEEKRQLFLTCNDELLTSLNMRIVSSTEKTDLSSVEVGRHRLMAN